MPRIAEETPKRATSYRKTGATSAMVKLVTMENGDLPK